MWESGGRGEVESQRKAVKGGHQQHWYKIRGAEVGREASCLSEIFNDLESPISLVTVEQYQ